MVTTVAENPLLEKIGRLKRGPYGGEKRIKGPNPYWNPASAVLSVWDKVMTMPSALLLLTTASVLLVHQAPPKSDFRVYYVPFALQTLHGMDSKGIEEYFEVSPALKEDRAELRRLLARDGAKPSTLLKHLVRLKVIDSKDVWIVDQRGNVQHRGATYFLGEERFAKLETFMLKKVPDFDRFSAQRKNG